MSQTSLSDHTGYATDHMAVMGLLRELPPVGTEWPTDKRDEWVAAMLSVFAVIYPASDPDVEYVRERTLSGEANQ